MHPSSRATNAKDQAAALATVILQIIAEAPLGARRAAIEGYLRDELTAMRRQIAADLAGKQS